MKRLFFGVAHGLLLYGHYAKSRGVAAGLDARRLYVIYNSLDYDAQTRVRNGISRADVEEVRQQLFPGSSAPIAIYVGRLTTQTQLELLLQAQLKLRDRGHQINVLIVGDGILEKALKVYANENSLSVAFIHGMYDESRLGVLFRSAAVCVAPGKVGLTAMHSLAYGTPVITHACPEKQMPEFEAVVPGKTGSLFKDGDVESLVKCILTWTTPRDDMDKVRAQCIEVIQQQYSPGPQRRIIEDAIIGLLPPEVGPWV
jgi:glycosyltransferase involved in cell wall biosynthesis